MTRNRRQGFTVSCLRVVGWLLVAWALAALASYFDWPLFREAGGA